MTPMVMPNWLPIYSYDNVLWTPYYPAQLPHSAISPVVSTKLASFYYIKMLMVGLSWVSLVLQLPRTPSAYII